MWSKVLLYVSIFQRRFIAPMFSELEPTFRLLCAGLAVHSFRFTEFKPSTTAAATSTKAVRSNSKVVHLFAVLHKTNTSNDYILRILKNVNYDGRFFNFWRCPTYSVWDSSDSIIQSLNINRFLINIVFRCLDKERLSALSTICSTYVLCSLSLAMFKTEGQQYKQKTSPQNSNQNSC